MKFTPCVATIVVGLMVGFGAELATHSVANDDLLLKLGALPDNGQLQGQYWRFLTYSFLHFNWVHLSINTLLLFWIGRILELRIGTALTATLYVCSVLCSAAVIIAVHILQPKTGATVGASGGVFGLLAAALVFTYCRVDLLEDRLTARIWIVLLAGLGISLLPEISMAGHVGGIIGGAVPAGIVSVTKSREPRRAR